MERRRPVKKALLRESCFEPGYGRAQPITREAAGFYSSEYVQSSSLGARPSEGAALP